MLCKYKQDFCVQVKNKPCVEYTVIMRLISWIHSHGKTVLVNNQMYIMYNIKILDASKSCQFLTTE
jgi:hypothetical protein